MGKVKGNIECSDRVDIRSEGSVTGDVITQRISVEDGAVLKGGIQVRSADLKHDKGQHEFIQAVIGGPETGRARGPQGPGRYRRRVDFPSLTRARHGLPPAKGTILFFPFTSLSSGFNSSDAEFMQ